MAGWLNASALTMIPVSLLALADCASAGGPLVHKADGQSGSQVLFWLETSLTRVYPTSQPGSKRTLVIPAARNGRVSFQACVRNQQALHLSVECSTPGAEGLQVQVRRVGYVPMRFCTTGVDRSEIDGGEHVPGFVPDPLFADSKADVGPYENASFWITVTVPSDAKPGPRTLALRYSYGKEPSQQAELSATVDVKPFTIQPRHDFPVTNWWRAETIWDWYKTEPFDERWWGLTRKYIDDMVAHGNDVVYVPIFFMRREVFKRPAQLLIVTEPSPGVYRFDFSRVKRFVDMAKQSGVSGLEWSHFWIYWGVEHAMRIYKMESGAATLLWPLDTGATSDTYLNFLKQFLPEFHKFLKEEDLLDRSYFHLSDEPSGVHVENYRKARAVLKEYAPWMKVMDALSDIEFGRQGLTDMPIPVISSAPAYIEAKIPHWVYFCCEPRGRYLQRLMDTPLPKIRMSGWLFYRLGAKGFLHWGYNYWHVLEQEQLIDPFADATAACWPTIPPGDPFVVYPGPDGPLDSVRWEVFAESLQDYAILQTAGIKPDDPMLSAIKDYADFPKSQSWIDRALKTILDPK